MLRRSQKEKRFSCGFKIKSALARWPTGKGEVFQAERQASAKGQVTAGHVGKTPSTPGLMGQRVPGLDTRGSYGWKRQREPNRDEPFMPCETTEAIVGQGLRQEKPLAGCCRQWQKEYWECDSEKFQQQNADFALHLNTWSEFRASLWLSAVWMWLTWSVLQMLNSDVSIGSKWCRSFSLATKLLTWKLTKAAKKINWENSEMNHIEFAN